MFKIFCCWRVCICCLNSIEPWVVLGPNQIWCRRWWKLVPLYLFNLWFFSLFAFSLVTLHVLSILNVCLLSATFFLLVLAFSLFPCFLCHPFSPIFLSFTAQWYGSSATFLFSRQRSFLVVQTAAVSISVFHNRYNSLRYSLTVMYRMASTL